ncbi:FadR/GntR family transcriptional regulator [Arthrobacter sp. GMC3]|uniref:FadR/GntR family transcriptional regulator n=1 Tax=Arthrobacter sp. GMC3 TaxID=2058894 RepID=UPI000CE47515|nr:FadR/GntR family transcriptional regulator [Arthrobacter sp. GMC3]
MTLTPSHREPLAQEVTGKLRTAISSGLWALNERIPSEQVLMKELGVSRGTLREALRALAHAGMLEVRRGDGTFVRATSEIAGATAKLLSQHGDKHVIEVRLALDSQAARLAALNAKETEIREMRALLAGRRRAAEQQDTQAWLALDWDFHLAVARASGNPLLGELYESFGSVFISSLISQLGDHGLGYHPEGHEDLLAAIEAGDQESAAASVSQHLDSRLQSLQD